MSFIAITIAFDKASIVIYWLKSCCVDALYFRDSYLCTNNIVDKTLLQTKCLLKALITRHLFCFKF